jgi:hypothetical protein
VEEWRRFGIGDVKWPVGIFAARQAMMEEVDGVLPTFAPAVE